MFRTFRNTLMATTTKSAGAVLIAALISTGTAVADDISKVTGNIGGNIPLKVVILSADGRFREIGRTPDYKTGSFSIDLKEKVSKYHWEVFAPKDVEPCDKKRDETKSSLNVKCLRSKAEEKPPSPTAAPSPQQGSGQQHDKDKSQAAPKDSGLATQVATVAGRIAERLPSYNQVKALAKVFGQEEIGDLVWIQKPRVDKEKEIVAIAYKHLRTTVTLVATELSAVSCEGDDQLADFAIREFAQEAKVSVEMLKSSVFTVACSSGKLRLSVKLPATP